MSSGRATLLPDRCRSCLKQLQDPGPGVLHVAPGLNPSNGKDSQSAFQVCQCRVEVTSLELMLLAWSTFVASPVQGCKGGQSTGPATGTTGPRGLCLREGAQQTAGNNAWARAKWSSRSSSGRSGAGNNDSCVRFRSNRAGAAVLHAFQACRCRVEVTSLDSTSLVRSCGLPFTGV